VQVALFARAAVAQVDSRMRLARGRGKTASHVRRTLQKVVVVLCFGALLACGKKSSELREWRPEDHQPPPSVPPEGQGSADESGDSTSRAATALFSMRCASCHGEGGHGDGTGKPPGAQLPDFASSAFQDARSDGQLYEAIAKGRGLMPAFGAEITEAGIAALIAHVRALRSE
jgi:mono/diheme cytochrome c family protein